MDDAKQLNDFAAVKMRLEEIVEAVSDDQLSLDDALDLYEEAVNLGLRVSDLLEDNITADELARAASADENGGESPEDAAPSDAEPADVQQAVPMQENATSLGE